jgi:hypothetical protein
MDGVPAPVAFSQRCYAGPEFGSAFFVAWPTESLLIILAKRYQDSSTRLGLGRPSEEKP